MQKKNRPLRITHVFLPAFFTWCHALWTSRSLPFRQRLFLVFRLEEFFALFLPEVVICELLVTVPHHGRAHMFRN